MRLQSLEAKTMNWKKIFLWFYFVEKKNKQTCFCGVCCCCRAGQGAGFLCGRDQLHPSGEPQFPDSTELHVPKEMGTQGW